MPSATARVTAAADGSLTKMAAGTLAGPDLLLDPAHRLGVGHAEQEEQVGGTGADGEAQPHVVGVDQRDRAHRHVQAAGRLDQRHHRAVQREQQLPEPSPTARSAIARSFVRFDYRLPDGIVGSAIG